MLSISDQSQLAGRHAAVNWLLSSDEPAVRLLTRRDVFGEQTCDDLSEVLTGPKVTTLLSGQQADGGFGGHPTRKFDSGFYRLIALVELSIPPREPRAVAAVGHVLDWILSRPRHRGRPQVIDDLHRTCAYLEGYALAVSCRLGLATDARVQRMAEALIEWQWPDGGWNCDRKASGRRSSFHETHSPAWGLHEYAEATGNTLARQAADRAAELFLTHRLFYSLSTGKVISRSWLQLHYPPYWHYDILQALLILSRMGKVTDPRANDALDELERRCRPDGRWEADWQYWKRDEHKTTEVVDWGRKGQPNEMVTLNALRVLRAAGRLS